MTNEMLQAIITGAQNIAIIFGISWVLASALRKTK